MTTIRGARLVLEHEVLEGDVTFEDGRIVSIDPRTAGIGSACEGSRDGSRDGSTRDVHGDWLMPGLVELHTDHLETHHSPRPGVRWSGIAAIQAHDAQIATAGITTVFDCLRVGTDDESDIDAMPELARELRQARVEGRLRAEHRLHLRCEVSASNALAGFAAFADDPALWSDVGLVSLMDHTPGQRQFATIDAVADYYKRNLGYDDATFARLLASRLADSERYSGPHREAISALCRERGVPLASHDDALAGHVEESCALGASIAEFPTSLAAAGSSRERGMRVLMGAPNVVRGLSHSGNVSARELAASGLLDILSSDYVPSSLLQAAFTLALDVGTCDLPSAVRLVTLNPANAVGLTDRGRIAIGCKADLVQVSASAGQVPVVRRVWRDGRRVA